MFRDEVDVAVAYMTYTLERAQDVAFTISLDEEVSDIIIWKTVKGQFDVFAYLLLYSKEAWFGVALFILIVGIIIVLMVTL